GLEGHVLEADAARVTACARAEIVEQPGHAAGKRPGAAVITMVALAVAADLGRVIVDIVGHDEVEPAIAIVVHEAGGGGPERIVEAGLARDFPKGAVAVVEKEPDSAVLGDQDIRPAVVVDVANRHAHAVADHIEPGARADIDKAAVGPLAEEPIARLRLRAAVLHEIDVEAAVLVEIEKREAGAEKVRQEIMIQRHRAGLMDEV